MTLSQSYPSTYPSFLYPPNSTPSTFDQILPKIHDAALSGNAASYQSKLVGGRRSRRNRHSHHRSRKFGGRRYRKKRTQKHKKK